MATMTRAAELKTLVLNADFQPLEIWPLSIEPAEELVSKLIRERVYSVADWEDRFFRSPTVVIPVPKVVVLRHYANVGGDPKFCRRSVFLRDEWICQYCGKPFPSEDLTFDHVIPRDKGGQTVWENILTACIDCNLLKRNEHANWSGRKGHKDKSGRLRPLKAPYQPTNTELLRKGLKHLPAEVLETWRDWLYWEAELVR